MHSTKVIDTPYIRFGVVVVVGCRVCTCAFYSFTKCPSPTPLINNGDLLDFHSTIYTTLFFLRRVICFPRTCFFFALSIYFFVYRVRCCSVSLNSLSVCCHSICLFRRLDATTFKHGHKKNTHSDFLQCICFVLYPLFVFRCVFFLVQNLLGSRIGDSNHYIHILPMSMYKPHNIPSNVSVSVYLRIIIILWMIFFCVWAWAFFCRCLFSIISRFIFSFLSLTHVSIRNKTRIYILYGFLFIYSLVCIIHASKQYVCLLRVWAFDWKCKSPKAHLPAKISLSLHPIPFKITFASKDSNYE